MPDPVLVDITIINRALARIGGGAITSTDEDTELAASVMAVYPDVVDVAHAAYPWKWARRTAKLDQLAVTPINGFSKAYGFPADALGQPLKLSDRPNCADNPLRRFSVEGRTVYANCDAVYGAFVMRIAPSDWPPSFRLAVTVWLSAEFCVPVTHDANLADALRKTAIGAPSEEMRGGLLGRAIALDVSSGGGVAPLLADDPLTSARFDGPWHGDF